MMAAKMRELGIERLSVEEKLELMQEIWESISSETDRTHLTEPQREELERRLAEHEADPGDVVAWEEVKADALARFQKP